jgi:hypothetical protein
MRLKKIIFLALFAMLLAFVFFFPVSTRAQAPTINIPIALAPLTRDTLIELTALTLDAEIREINGHTFIIGNATFKLHNTDKLNDLSVPVGLPTWAGDPYAFDLAKFDTFTVTIDSKRVNPLNPAQADLRIGREVRSVNWYTFTLTIPGDEKKMVRYDFQQDLGESIMPRFVFGMVPATGWKNSVGSARVQVKFPENTTLEQIIASDPANSQFDGASIAWNFTTNEPVVNPSLTFVRPSVWSDLQAKRRATQQSPNDANAHTALGNAFRQLAQSDTPRRDSFFAQAIAEFETAVRLDSNQRAARQALAAIYESRAGAATGPRNAAYVELAIAQWQVLAANDANARKQLAEDYFYLGLDAQTRGAYADAIAFYDQARGLQPNGAGPLFTTERANVQRRALNIAWARSLLAQNELAPATDKARAVFGDAFLVAYTPPLFVVTRAQVTMAHGLRTMAFSITPIQSAATLEQLNRIANEWRAEGARVEIAPDASALSVTIPFGNNPDLMNKLGNLIHPLPDQAEWALIRAVVAPSHVEWSDTEEWLIESLQYRESVNLAPACAKFNAQLAVIAPNLTPLEKASPNDDEAQLKRALLTSAQSGWRNALAQGRVVYRAGDQEQRVEACASREITLEASPFRVEMVVGIVGIIFVLGIVGGVMWWRGRKRASTRQ